MATAETMTPTEIEPLFQHYLAIAGDAAAAATLVLAHATVDGKAAPVDAMLTIRDVATRLSVNEHTVRGLIRLGKLASTRVGQGRGAVRVSPQALDAFVASQGRTPLVREPTRRHRLLGI